MAVKNLKYWPIAILLALLVLYAVQIQSRSRGEPAKLFTHPNRYTAISAGWDHCLALRSDGSIEAWGDNEWGKAEPPEGNDFIAIAAGYGHSLALRSNGTIVQWGYNSYGKSMPPDENAFVDISAGYGYSLALRSDGTIIGWGENSFGKSDSPSGSDFVDIAADGIYSLALKSDGSIIGWGHNTNDRLNLPNGNDFTTIATGSGHSLALKSDGSIVGWGVNFSGEANPPSGNDYVAIAAGDSHSLALRADGSIIGWGSNMFKQARSPEGNDYVAITAGKAYSLALKSDGSIVGWGKKVAMAKPILPQPKKKKETEKDGCKKDTMEVVEVKNVSELKSIVTFPKAFRLTIDNVCIDLVYIKPGSFLMGRNIGWEEKFLSRIAPMNVKYPNEGPSRKVKITKGFYIGKYKVTCAQFCEFLNSIGNPLDYVELNKFARIEIKDGIYIPKKNCANGAINIVHWKGASAFCEWLSKQTGFTVRLPTETEWEFVARGPEGRTYPWGEDEYVKYFEDHTYEYNKYPHPWSCDPVNAFPDTATPDGVVGLLGMVGEWCSDYYVSRYLKDDLIDPKGPTEEKLKEKSANPLDYKYHVFRGRLTSSKGRAFGNTVHGSGIYGFRIVVELPTK